MRQLQRSTTLRPWLAPHGPSMIGQGRSTDLIRAKSRPTIISFWDHDIGDDDDSGDDGMMAQCDGFDDDNDDNDDDDAEGEDIILI